MNQEEGILLVVILTLKLQCLQDLCIYTCWGAITITGAGDDTAGRQADERNKGVIFKKLCAIYSMHK